MLFVCCSNTEKERTEARAIVSSAIAWGYRLCGMLALAQSVARSVEGRIE